jgi:hypothetical protein
MPIIVFFHMSDFEFGNATRLAKLHLCVDATSSTIVGAVLTTTDGGDASQISPPRRCRLPPCATAC